MLRILGQRNFRLLWAAGLISLIGDWVMVVGLPVEVYARTHSTLATMARGRVHDPEASALRGADCYHPPVIVKK